MTIVVYMIANFKKILSESLREKNGGVHYCLKHFDDFLDEQKRSNYSAEHYDVNFTT